MNATAKEVINQDGTVFGTDLTDAAVNWQNGPDQVQLWDSAGRLIDSVCYGFSADLVCEGTEAQDVSGTSLVRCPDGTDTDKQDKANP